MSEYIKKLSGGGTSNPVVLQETKQETKQDEPVKLFETTVGKYDANLLAKNFENNLGSYIEHMGLKYGSKDYNNFIQEAAKIELGIKDGSFTRGDGRIYKGSIIVNNDRALSWALGLLDKVIDASKEYDEKAPTTTSADAVPFNANGLKTYFLNKEFGGQESPNLSSWLEIDDINENGERNTTNRSKSFASMLAAYADKIDSQNIDFTNSPFDDKQEYVSKLRAAASILQNKGYCTDAKLALNRIGIGSSLQDQLFSTKKEKKEETVQTPAVVNKPNDGDGNTKPGDDKGDTAPVTPVTPKSGHDQYIDFANKQWKANIGKPSLLYCDFYGLNADETNNKFISCYKADEKGVKKLLTEYIAKLLNQNITKDDWNKQYKFGDTSITGKELFYGSIIGAFAKGQPNEKRYYAKGGDNYYILPTLNFAKGSIIRYDLRKRKLYIEYYTPQNTILGKLMRQRYFEEYGVDPDSTSVDGRIEWGKHGAKLRTLKLLRGGSPNIPPENQDTVYSLSDDDDDYSDLTNYVNEKYEQQQDTARQSSLRRLMLEHPGLTEEVIANQNKLYHSEADGATVAAHWLRSAGTAANALSGIAVWVPGGLMTAAVAGLTGLGLQTAADLFDVYNGNMTMRDVAYNAGVNGALMLGSSLGFRYLKNAKSISTAVKNWGNRAIHYGMGGFGTVEFWKNDGFSRLKDLAFKKRSEMTIQDEQQLNALLSQFFGLTNFVGSSMHRQQWWRDITYKLNYEDFTPLNNANKQTYQIRTQDGKLVEVSGNQLQKMSEAVIDKVKNSKTDITPQELNDAATKAWVDNLPNGQRIAQKIQNGEFVNDDLSNLITPTDDGVDIKVRFGDTETTVHFTRQLQERLGLLEDQILRDNFGGKTKDLLSASESRDFAVKFTEMARQEIPSLMQQTTVDNDFRLDAYLDGISSPTSASGRASRALHGFENKEHYAQRKANDQLEGNLRTETGQLGTDTNHFDLSDTDGKRNYWLLSFADTPSKLRNFIELTGLRNNKYKPTMADVQAAQLWFEKHPEQIPPGLKTPDNVKHISDILKGIAKLDFRKAFGNSRETGVVRINPETMDSYKDYFNEAKVEPLTQELFNELYDYATDKDLIQYTGDRQVDLVFDLLEHARQTARTRNRRWTYDDLKRDLESMNNENERRALGNSGENSRNNIQDDDSGNSSTPEAKPEATPEAKPEATPEAKPEAKPEATPEAKPEAKPERDYLNKQDADDIDSYKTIDDLKEYKELLNSDDGFSNEYKTHMNNYIDEKINMLLEQDKTRIDRVKLILDNIDKKLNKTKKKAHLREKLRVKQIKKLLNNNSSSINEGLVEELNDILKNLKHGGVINKLIYLRGGIIKADDGTKVETKPSYQWYIDRYPQLSMLDAEELKAHNSYLGKSITDNGHNKAFDLSLAAEKNAAYIADHDAVGADINDYYDSDTNNASLDDFVKLYNQQMLTLRDTWGQNADGSKTNTLWHLNQKGVALKHNQLFRKLYRRRSADSAGPAYNIGYQTGTLNGVNIEDMMGSSTWMRRPDQWETEFDAKSSDAAKRIFKVKDLGYVYKKANGDIAVLPDDVAQAILNPLAEPEEEELVVYGAKVYGTNTGAGKRPSDGLKEFSGKVAKELKDRKPDIVAIGRYISNLRNNRKTTDLLLKLRTTLKNPLDEHSYVRDGYTGRLMAYNTAAGVQSQAGVARTSDESINNAYALAGAEKAADIRAKADLTSNDVMYKTAAEAETLDRKMHEYNHGVLDFNTAALTELLNDKTKIKASLLNANQTNFNTYSKEQEYRLREALDDKKTKREELKESYDAYLKILALLNDPTYKLLLAAYKEAIRTNAPNLEALGTALYNYRIQFNLDYQEAELERKAKEYDATFNKTETTWQPRVVQKKAGGTIDDTRVKKKLKDNEQIIKLIMFSINTSLKALDRLSRAKLLAIQKMLS